MEFGAYEIDESMTSGEVTGPAEQTPVSTVRNSSTKSLVALWFVVLGVYWFLGWLFRGRRGGK